MRLEPTELVQVRIASSQKRRLKILCAYMGLTIREWLLNHLDDDSREMDYSLAREAASQGE